VICNLKLAPCACYETQTAGIRSSWPGLRTPIYTKLNKINVKWKIKETWKGNMDKITPGTQKPGFILIYSLYFLYFPLFSVISGQLNFLILDFILFPGGLRKWT
jgi:hypothetical protein